MKRTSAPHSSASSTEESTGRSRAPASGGSSVLGATRATSIPACKKPGITLRATLLCSTSPTMAARRPLSPSKPPSASQRAYRSRRAWVGCWPQPSPALITGAEVWRAARTAAPAAWCRSTIASAPRRSRVTAVSIRDSPLAIAEPFSESEITCAPERLAASSKETAVLVEASKKAKQTVLPSSASLRRPSANALARSRICLMSSRPTCSRVRKPLVSNDDHPILPIGLLQVDKHSLAARGGHVLTDVVGADGQLPVAAVDENRQPDRGGPTEFEERVHRGACGPSRVQNVVDEDDGLACYVERHAAAPHFGILFFEVVAMERYIQRADGDPEALKLADVRRDTPRQRDSAGKHPYERELVEA